MKLLCTPKSNLAYKCSTMSPGNPFILGSKGQKSRSQRLFQTLLFRQNNIVAAYVIHINSLQYILTSNLIQATTVNCESKRSHALGLCSCRYSFVKCWLIFKIMCSKIVVFKNWVKQTVTQDSATQNSCWKIVTATLAFNSITKKIFKVAIYWKFHYVADCIYAPAAKPVEASTNKSAKTHAGTVFVPRVSWPCLLTFWFQK